MDLIHPGKQTLRAAFVSKRLPGASMPGIMGQFTRNPVSIRAVVSIWLKLAVSVSSTPTARMTSHFAAICLATYGRIVALWTRETTTFLTPLAANALPTARVISSAPTLVASARPTIFDDEGTDRILIFFNESVISSAIVV